MKFLLVFLIALLLAGSVLAEPVRWCAVFCLDGDTFIIGMDATVIRI